MKKGKKSENLEEMLGKFRRNKYISILLALFTLGVNIFAWFAFSANAGLGLDGTVSSWDVEFKDSSGEVFRNIVVDVTKMKPGMPNFSETIEIESRSDVQSTFSYEVVSFSLLGTNVDLTNKSNVIQYLNSFYPFSISFTPSSTTLSPNDSITFSVGVVWPYESQTPQYFAQDEVYDYNESFVYYTLSGSNYVETNVSNSSAYTSNKANLFLEKDDADTYFGMQCKSYETSSGNPCLSMTVRLLVEQDL